MTLTVTPIEDATMADLRALILDVLGDIPVVQGQDNRVSQPPGPAYIIMTPQNRIRFATNVDSWDNAVPSPTATSTLVSTGFNVQLDCYGPNSADAAQILSTVLRSEYACAFMTGRGHGTQPLYATDPHQMPIIDGEAQYESRWTLEARLQVNPVISTPQQFADTLTATLVEIDTTYPP